MSIPWTRRRFLQATFGSLAALWITGSLPRTLWAGPLPEGRLSLYHLHTEERLSVTYRSASGDYDRQALQDLNYFFRCHDTNRATTMDLRVLEYLGAVDRQLGGDHELHIISGYRSPEYNERLIQAGRGVAKHSYHLQGQAVDFHIPGIDLTQVRIAALNLQLGGVGYYPESDFLHIDSGPPRWW